MISYVRIYGPPLLKALKALEKVAVGMPEVCIMDTPIAAHIGISQMDLGDRLIEPSLASQEGVMKYFGEGVISGKRCDTIISKSGESLGEYDFYFEWFIKPTMKQVEDLIERIDGALEPLDVKYTITTK
ncbi:hypothetical protein A3K81_06830 [Candidatus Bathyarchaeota archaeon RBG_13_60_20]|nr:MAG: hypothetical protein A3K81_06830 [Candidatus Bathyarchaeota archaeon RBG_13_60_20]